MAGNDVNEQNRSYIPIDISITSEYHTSEDSDWQEQCNQLYQQLNNAIDEGTIEPRKVEVQNDGHRGGFLELFNTITAGIASIGGLSALIEIAKIWLEHRKGSEVSLKFPDGSEIKLSSASESDLERILELYEKKLSHPSAE